MAIIDNGSLQMSGSLQHRRAFAEEWEASMYVPAAGEICVATDTGETRIGNGVDTWSNLPNPFKVIVEGHFDDISGFDFGVVNE